MTEFHQFKEPQNHSLEPTSNPQEPVISTSTQKAPSSEPAIAATAEANANAAPQVEKPPYETVHQGPITYFRYYYEDAEQPTYLTSDSAELPAKRNFLPLYLAGSGVLGASLISGAVVVAGLVNNSKPQSPQGATQPDVKQAPKSEKIQPRVVPPEAIPQPRSTSKKSPQNLKKTPPQKSSTRVAVPPAPKLLLQQAVVRQALMVPAPLPVSSLPTVAVAVDRSRFKPLPSPSVPPTQTAASQPESPLATVPLQSSPPPPVVTTAPPASAPAIVSPSENSPPVVADASLTSPAEVAPASPEPVTPPQSTANARCLSPQANTQPSLTDSPTLRQVAMSVSAPETMTAGSKAQTEKGRIVETAEAIAASSALPDAEKELQAFLELPQQFPTSAGLSIMPLPCQIAQTAITKQRMGEFTVLKLSPQDYQKRWKTSSKNPEALTPIYGFVDYKQQSIVLVANRTE